MVDTQKTLPRGDRFGTFLAYGDTVRLSTVVLTRSVQEAARRHNTNPAGTILLGEAMLGAVLDVSLAKGGIRVLHQHMLQGPIGQIEVEATHRGEVRAFCANPQPAADAATAQELLNKNRGFGVLKVTRSSEEKPEPSTSTVEAIGGNVAKDLTAFYALSEQIPTAIRCEVQLDDDFNVAYAAAIMIQILPDAASASQADAGTLEQNLVNVDLDALLNSNSLNILELAAAIDPNATETRSMRADFFCGCSDKYYAARLKTLGVSELESLASDAPHSITCAYCAEEYPFSKDQFLQLAAEIKEELQ